LTQEQGDELVFVVDVTSFTENGFIGSSNFAESRVDIEFDDGSEGVSLSPEMAKKIKVKAGSPVLIIGENEEKPQTSESTVNSVGEKVRISDAKTYYFVGRYGGAIIRILKR
jgi:CO dehydrogenase/acetyl-CoA synthase epsilon subunit